VTTGERSRRPVRRLVYVLGARRTHERYRRSWDCNVPGTELWSLLIEDLLSGVFSTERRDALMESETIGATSTDGNHDERRVT